MSEAKQLAIPNVPEAPTGMVAMMERLALNPDLPVEKLEKLLEMQLRVREIEAKQAYAAALARLQPKLPIIRERGGIKNNSGAVQSKYALWEDVVGVVTPIISEEGFSLSFRTSSTDKTVTVTGVLTHEMGHEEQTSLTLPMDTSGSKNAVQSVGSSTSYGKRYTASALLNLRTGEKDDDGKSGGGAARITESQAADLEALMDELQVDKAAFLKYAAEDKMIGANAIEDIPQSAYQLCVDKVRAKGRQIARQKAKANG